MGTSFLYIQLFVFDQHMKKQFHSHILCSFLYFHNMIWELKFESSSCYIYHGRNYWSFRIS